MTTRFSSNPITAISKTLLYLEGSGTYCLVQLDAVCICPSVSFIPTHTDEIAFIVLKLQAFYNQLFNADARISSGQWLGGRENGIMQIYNTNTCVFYRELSRQKRDFDY